MSASEPITASFLSTDERRVSTVVDAARSLNKHFHFLMLTICSILLALVLIGSWRMSSWDFTYLFAVAIGLLVFLLSAIIWHDRRNYQKRDAVLTLPWVLALVILIPFPVEMSARLRFPLQDSILTKMDHALGFSVAGIVSWVSLHPKIGSVLSHSYGLLFYFMLAAALIPALTGRKKAAEEFVLANGIAFLLALPLFSLVPAVGPWMTEQFAATAAQQVCEKAIVALHASATAVSPDTAALVTFPSFHVIWAVLSGRALWSVRLLRIPAAVLSGLIVLSTVTTGWHYASDVLAGIIVAALGIWLAVPRQKP
jgi:membrane-associated phospholipid phosphatase